MVVETQAQALEEDGWSVDIVAGCCTSLWSGRSKATLIDGLRIPDAITRTILESEPTSHGISAVLERAKRLCDDLNSHFDSVGTDLVIVHNVCSLPYNLSAAIGIAGCAERSDCQFLHIGHDFFWQHSNDNRSIFDGAKASAEFHDLLQVLSDFSSDNWTNCVTGEGLKSMCASFGMNPWRTQVIRNPIVRPDLTHKADLEGVVLAAERHGEENLHGLTPLAFSTGEASWAQAINVLIATKLSRTKRVPQTILEVVQALAHFSPLAPVQIVVSGGAYDMESEEGLRFIWSELHEVFDSLRTQSTTGKLPPVRVVVVGGAVRFRNGKSVSMDELYACADLVVIGSAEETDCPAAMEAMLAKKPVWVRRWSGTHDRIFESIFGGLVIGVLGEAKSAPAVNPYDRTAVAAASSLNARVVGRNRSKANFLSDLRRAIPFRAPSSPSRIPVEIIKALRDATAHDAKTRQRIMCIGGASGTGKSTLAAAISSAASERGITCQAVSLDDFFPDGVVDGRPRASIPEDCRLNALLATIQSFQNRIPVIVPKYNHGTERRTRRILEPAQVLIVEGLFALNDSGRSTDGGSYEQLRDLSFFNIFLRDSITSVRRSIAQDLARKRDTSWLGDRLSARREETRRIDRGMLLSPDCII